MTGSHVIFGILSVWIYMICSIESQAGVGRGQIPVGAFHIFPKTSFSCVGRPAGYYADIETGCQVYHMCDGLGRQFTYSCPNTTLFQQRMLVCDHWYMVNCSRAERDYAANLLIGQRDKPFVPEEENMLRTPRPDLLDRPYAADYLGESFRNQFKVLPPITNQITDENGNYDHDLFRSSSQTPTRWRIRHEKQPIRKPTRPIVVDDTQENNHVTTSNRRIDETDDNSSIDLGTSYSSNYNTSSDISTEQNDLEQSTESNDVIKSGEKFSIKRPSIIYEPPFLYPIYNENYTETTTEEPTTTTVVPPTTLPTTMIPTTKIPPTTTTRPTTTRFTTRTTTARPLHRPTTFTPRPFGPPIIIPTTPLAPTLPIQPDTTEQNQASSTEDTNINETSLVDNFEQENQNVEEQTTQNLNTPALSQFLLPPEVPKTPTALPRNRNIPKPSIDILPPFQEFVTHDVATTQGPPIYYEWKVPSDALEPPKLDPPISVFGKRVDPDYNKSNKVDIENEKDNITFRFLNNPFLSSYFIKNQNSKLQTKSPTPRSIQSSNIKINSPTNDSQATNKVASVVPPTQTDIQQLQRQFLIPDFLFPLENEGRTGYEHTDTVNSFQLRIPHRRSDNKPWYGENPECPECHPSYVKPGTCEPCIQRR